MDAWQFISAIEYKVGKLTHADSPNDPVFASVRATPGLGPGDYQSLNKPCALIRPGPSTRDPQRPGIFTMRVDILIATIGSGDQVGRSALMGAGQTLGKSAGKGNLEFDLPLHTLIDTLNRLYGFGLQLVATSEAAATLFADSGFICERVHTLEGRITSAREYPPPQEVRPGALVAPRALSLAAQGGGVVRVSWTPALPERFDFHAAQATSGALWPFTQACGGLVLRYKAGAVAPTSPTGADGSTAVPLGADQWGLVTVDTPAIALGQTSFTLFAGYGEPNVTRYAQDASGNYVGATGSIVVT